jgi:hypothetical protein
MSCSAYAYIAVGVDAKTLVKHSQQARARKRFDPETGQESLFEYKQETYWINGQELPITLKKIVRDFGREYPEMGYDITWEFSEWLDRNGFDHEIVRFHQSSNGHIPPHGVIGKKLDGSGDMMVVDAAAIREAVKQVRQLLLGIGCNLEPKCYVIPRLC